MKKIFLFFVLVIVIAVSVSVVPRHNEKMTPTLLQSLHLPLTTKVTAEGQLYVRQLEKCFDKIAGKDGRGYCGYFLADMDNDDMPNYLSSLDIVRRISLWMYIP